MIMTATDMNSSVFKFQDNVSQAWNARHVTTVSFTSCASVTPREHFYDLQESIQMYSLSLSVCTKYLSQLHILHCTLVAVC